MSGDGVDTSKRRFLIAATTVVGGVGAVYTAVPFLASWLPSERAKAAGAPVEADISKLAWQAGLGGEAHRGDGEGAARPQR